MLKMENPGRGGRAHRGLEIVATGKPLDIWNLNEISPETQSEHDLSGQLHRAYDLIGKLVAEKKALVAQLYSDEPVAENAE